MAMSIADRVRALLGGGSSAQAPARNRYGSTRSGTIPGLTDAIQRRQPVQFFYTDSTEPNRSGLRYGNPHALFSKGGKTYLHMYVDPRSTSVDGRLPDWRTFLVSRIGSVAIQELGESLFADERKFNLARGYNPSWYSRVGRAIVLAS